MEGPLSPPKPHKQKGVSSGYSCGSYEGHRGEVTTRAIVHTARHPASATSGQELVIKAFEAIRPVYSWGANQMKGSEGESSFMCF